MKDNPRKYSKDISKANDDERKILRWVFEVYLRHWRENEDYMKELGETDEYPSMKDRVLATLYQVKVHGIYWEHQEDWRGTDFASQALAKLDKKKLLIKKIRREAMGDSMREAHDIVDKRKESREELKKQFGSIIGLTEGMIPEPIQVFQQLKKQMDSKRVEKVILTPKGAAFASWLSKEMAY